MKGTVVGLLRASLALSASLALLGCGADSDSPGAPAVFPADAATDDDASASADADVDTATQADVADTGEPVDSSTDSAGDAMDDTGEGDAAGGDTVTILSLNLHCLKVEGTAFATNEERFAAIAQAVAAEDVRAIAVQEACETVDVKAMDLLGAALESVTGATWQKAWQQTHVAWQGTADEAMEGVGLFVRGTISDVRPIVYRVPGALARAAISAVLPAELGGMRLVSTHLDYSDPAARWAQARESASVAVALSDPSLDVIVAGDFNATTQQPAYAAMTGFGFRDLTASLDPGRIDHIFAHRGAGLELLGAKKILDGTQHPVVSDHHGVLVRARRAAAPDVTRTRIRIQADASEWLAVRGDSAPLTWQEGYAALQGTDEWMLVLTEIGAGVPFEFKCLRGDSAWEAGDNHMGAGGESLVVTPAF